MAIKQKLLFLPGNSRYWKFYAVGACIFVGLLILSFTPAGDSPVVSIGLPGIPILFLAVGVIESMRQKN